MPRVPVIPAHEATDPDFPWLTFSQAVQWICHRRLIDRSGDAFVPLGDPTTEERAAVEEAKRLLRNALAGGAIVAVGELGGGISQEVDAYEWITRKVLTIENQYFIAPYRRFRVRRLDVLKLWPAAGTIRAAVAGRPQEIDWDRMKDLASAAIAARPGIAIGSLADSLSVEYHAAVDRSRSAPDPRGISRKLKQWGFYPE